MKKIKQKNSAQDLRKQCFISQDELAKYLGISTSLLAMYETGNRGLPTAAILKLAELQVFLGQNKSSRRTGRSWTAMQPAISKQQDKARKKMEHHVSIHRSGIEMLNYNIKKTGEEQEKATAWLNMLDDMLGSLPKTAATKKDRDWLEEQRQKMIKRILMAGEKQGRMGLKAKLLKAAVEVYEASGAII